MTFRLQRTLPFLGGGSVGGGGGGGGDPYIANRVGIWNFKTSTDNLGSAGADLNFSVLNGDAYIDGTLGLVLDGVGDYVQTAAAATAYAPTGSYVLELLGLVQTTLGNRTWFTQTNPTGNQRGLVIRKSSVTQVQIIHYLNGGTSNSLVALNAADAAATRYNVAIIYDHANTRTRAYIGTASSYSSPTNAIANPTYPPFASNQPYRVGYLQSGAENYLDGSIEAIRLTDGLGGWDTVLDLSAPWEFPTDGVFPTS